MQPARAVHLSRHIQDLTKDGPIQLLGGPEKLNESFRDLPCYGGLSVAWAQLVYSKEGPCCPGFGEEIEVKPSDLGDKVALQVYRRRDGKGFPHSNFYNFVIADSLHLPPDFENWFVEADESDPVHICIVHGEWMLRKPVALNVHVHAALHVPKRSSGIHVHLSEEQQRILDSPSLMEKRGVIRILAAAGSGKTTTLLAIAERGTCHTVYAVFNKSMQTEAEHKFSHAFVDCQTWDALARSYVQRHLNNGRTFEVMDSREETLQHGKRLVWRVVQKFCQSADGLVGVHHVEQVEDGVAVRSRDGSMLSQTEVASLAQAMYDKASDFSVVPDHSVVFKMCQLDMRRTHRRLTEPAACRLLCDEFQDVNPVQADVARMEAANCLLVAVGDPGQSIYKFRGACHALQDLRNEALATFRLSGSFRFGGRIAAMASVAQSLHADDSLTDYETIPCRGMAKEVGTPFSEADFPNRRPPASSSYTVICKTNKQAITLALELLARERGRNVILIGEPLQQELALHTSLRMLCERGVPFTYQMYLLDSLESAASVGAMLKQHFKEFQLDRAVKMRQDYGNMPHQLMNAKQAISHSTPTVTFCTVHQAKGLEWDTVVLGRGCNVAWEEEIGVWQLTHSAVNCLYVAVTRARQRLYVPAEVMKLRSNRIASLPRSCPAASCLLRLGTHQLFHLIPEAKVERVREEGLEPDSDSHFVRLSGSTSCEVSSTGSQGSAPLYVVEVDWDILQRPGVSFRAGRDAYSIEQLRTIEPSTLSELEVLVPDSVPKEHIRRTYPLHPCGCWQSRHGPLSPSQWFTAFGSSRRERASQIIAGAEAAGRGARGKAWMIKRTGHNQFQVPSQSQAGVVYSVDLRKSTCECPDFQQRSGSCKHILAAKAYHDSSAAR